MNSDANDFFSFWLKLREKLIKLSESSSCKLGRLSKRDWDQKGIRPTILITSISERASTALMKLSETSLNFFLKC